MSDNPILKELYAKKKKSTITRVGYAEGGEAEQPFTHVPGIEMMQSGPSTQKAPMEGVEPESDPFTDVAGGYLGSKIGRSVAGAIMSRTATKIPHNFSIMTAENPNAQQLSTAQNAMLNKSLKSDLDKAGIKYHEVQGSYGPTKENSILIPHSEQASPETIAALGKKYGQESVIHKQGNNNTLEYVTGPKAGSTHTGSGIVVDPSLQENYSQLGNKKFNLNLDFSKTNEPNLTHYSQYPGELSEIDPSHMGSGKQGLESRRGDIVPRSYYYEHGQQPEDVVTSGAKHAYEVAHPGKVLDVQSPEGMALRGQASDMNHLEQLIKDAGYSGYKNSAHPTLPGAVAMFGKHPVKKVKFAEGGEAPFTEVPYTPGVLQGLDPSADPNTFSKQAVGRAANLVTGYGEDVQRPEGIDPTISPIDIAAGAAGARMGSKLGAGVASAHEALVNNEAGAINPRAWKEAFGPDVPKPNLSGQKAAKSQYDLPEVKKALAGVPTEQHGLTLANDSDAYEALMRAHPQLVNDENWTNTVLQDLQKHKQPTGKLDKVTTFNPSSSKLSKSAQDTIDQIKEKNLTFFEPEGFSQSHVAKNEAGEPIGHLGLDNNFRTQSIKIDPDYQGQGVASTLYEKALNRNGLLRSSHIDQQLEGGQGLWKKFAEEHPYHVRQARDPKTLEPLNYKVWEKDTNVPMRKKEIALESKIDDMRDQISDAARAEDLEPKNEALMRLQKQHSSVVSSLDEGTQRLYELHRETNIPYDKLMSGTSGHPEADYLAGEVQKWKKLKGEVAQRHAELKGTMAPKGSEKLGETLKDLIQQHNALTKKSGHTMYAAGGFVSAASASQMGNYAEGGVAGEPEGLDAFIGSQGQPQAPMAQGQAPGEPEGLNDFIASEKYNTPGETFKAGLRGVGQGIAGPLAPLAEQKLLGTSPEELRGSQEAHPIAHGAGEALGLAGSMFTGVGEGAIAAHVGEMAAAHIAESMAAKAAAKAAFETGIIAAGGETSKLINQDPNASVQTAIVNTGLASLMGGVGGAALGKVSELWSDSAGPKTEKFINEFKDRMDYRLSGDGAKFTTYDPFTHQEVERKLGLGSKIADFMMDKAARHMTSEALGMASGEMLGHSMGLPPAMGALLGERALTPLFEHVMPALAKGLYNNEAASNGFKAAVDYSMAVAKGENLLGKATRNIFKAGAEVLPEHAMPTQKELDKLDKHVKEAQTNPESLMQVGSNAQSYMPDHGQAGAQLAAMATNYLNGLRPQANKQFPLDPTPKMTPAQMSDYNAALRIAQQPLAILHDAKEGSLTPVKLQTLNTLYPQLHQRMVSKLTDEMTTHISKGQDVPYKIRMSLSMLMGQPLDATMSPAGIVAAQPIPVQQAPAPKASKPSESSSKGLSKLGVAAATPLQQRQMEQIKHTK